MINPRRQVNWAGLFASQMMQDLHRFENSLRVARAVQSEPRRGRRVGARPGGAADKFARQVAENDQARQKAQGALQEQFSLWEEVLFDELD